VRYARLVGVNPEAQALDSGCGLQLQPIFTELDNTLSDTMASVLEEVGLDRQSLVNFLNNTRANSPELFT